MFNPQHSRGVMLCAAASLLSAAPVLGQCTVVTLATFNPTATNGPATPEAGLTLVGNALYGTTNYGGRSGDGTVFSVPITGGVPTTLCNIGDCGGFFPSSGVIAVGNSLYGVTPDSSYGPGVLYALPIPGGSPTALATFNTSSYPDVSGEFAGPNSGLIHVGNLLYGTTGGLNPSVYSVPMTGGMPTMLSAFDPYAEVNGITSTSSGAGVVLAGGALYGLNRPDGYTGGYGSVFSAPLAGGAPTMQATFNGSNGTMPTGGLTLFGNVLYGTTTQGGAYGDGTVFSVPVGGGAITVLANFNGSDGQNAQGGLVISGNTIYGTTASGGASNMGTVFSVPLSGGNPTVLASFNGSNGDHPLGGVIVSGNTLYGTASEGTNSYGSVFAIPLTSGVSLTVTSGQTYHFPASNQSGISIATVAGMSIQTGGAAIVDPAAKHSSRQLIVIAEPGLFFGGSAGSWSGLLDLSNNDLDLQAGDLATVTSQIAQGYNAGRWNGTGGINSSTAAADTTHLTALGVIQNNQAGTAIYGNGSNQKLFDGTTPGASDILIKYTYYGDTTLKGYVDGTDYSRIDNAYLSDLTNPGEYTGWFNGDFNYDGVIDGSDYTLIDNAFNTQGAALSSQAANVTAEIVPVSSVPEPACMLLWTAYSVALLRRRNRLSRVIHRWRLQR